MWQQWEQDQWSSPNNFSKHDSSQLLLQKPIAGLLLELHGDAKTLVAAMGEEETTKPTGNVSMFPRLTSYSLAPPVTGGEPGSRTFMGGSVWFTHSLLHLAAAVPGTTGQLCRAGVTGTWLSGSHPHGQERTGMQSSRQSPVLGLKEE